MQHNTATHQRQPVLSIQGTAEAPATGSDADLGMLLESTSVGPLLQRLSFAYSKCLLCVEGSTAFEYKLAEQAGRLYSMGRHCGISLQYFYTSTQLATEVCSYLFLYLKLACNAGLWLNMCAHLYTCSCMHRSVVPSGSHLQLGKHTSRCCNIQYVNESTGLAATLMLLVSAGTPSTQCWLRKLCLCDRKLCKPEGHPAGGCVMSMTLHHPDHIVVSLVPCALSYDNQHFLLSRICSLSRFIHTASVAVAKPVYGVFKRC